MAMLPVVPNTMEEAIPHGSDGFNFEAYVNEFPDVRENTELLYSHWHHEYEINYVERGEIEFRVDGAAVVLSGGQALIVDRYAIHGCRSASAGAHRYVSLVFGENLLVSDARDLVCLKYFMPMLRSQKRPPALLMGARSWEAEALPVIRTLCERAVARPPAYELDIKIRLLELFSIFIRHGALEDAVERNRFADVRIKEAINFIHEHYDRKLNVGDIAASMNLCTEHFIRSFKALTGKTPKDYLICHRVSRVMARIAAGEQSISEIAAQCGFEDVCYLSRCFKKHIGLSPQAYRRSLGMP